jgi:hypothetical protein
LIITVVSIRNTENEHKQYFHLEEILFCIPEYIYIESIS